MIRVLLIAVGAYAVIWIAAWIYCLANTNGQSRLPEDLQ
jgi:hypothetical protein